MAPTRGSFDGALPPDTCGEKASAGTQAAHGACVPGRLRLLFAELVFAMCRYQRTMRCILHAHGVQGDCKDLLALCFLAQLGLHLLGK